MHKSSGVMTYCNSKPRKVTPLSLVNCTTQGPGPEKTPGGGMSLPQMTPVPVPSSNVIDIKSHVH